MVPMPSGEGLPERSKPTKFSRVDDTKTETRAGIATLKIEFLFLKARETFD